MVNEFKGADTIINLAGRNVKCLYNAQNKNDILESLVQSTRLIGEAIAEGFSFSFADWPEAAQDLVKRWREKPQTV